MGRLGKNLLDSGKRAVDEDGRWLIGVPAIVADNNDPEGEHRIRVIIPSIDEDIIFDEWARSFVFCLGSRFGTAFIPPKGSEVILFGQLGQKYNLFYASVYNEDFPMPENFPNEMTVGIHAPGNLIFIAELLAKIQAQNIELIAAEVAKIMAQTINLEASGTAKINGNEIKINGATITANANGSISITGGNISISGSSVTIEGRLVKKVGPPI